MSYSIDEIRQKVMEAGYSGETLVQALEILDEAERSGGFKPEHKEKLQALTTAEISTLDAVIAAENEAQRAADSLLTDLSNFAEEVEIAQVDAENTLNAAFADPSE